MGHTKVDWKDQLQESLDLGNELCHYECGDKAQKLVLYGKNKGAFCYACYREIARVS